MKILDSYYRKTTKRNANGLSSCVYLINLFLEDKIITKKVLLLKNSIC